MLYLNEKDLLKIGFHWDETIDTIEKAVHCLEQKDFVQPIKPYLRYRDLTNRIIALIAFVGGEINLAGIKWIASFPNNIDHGLPRAHSVVILNDADTGAPVATINTALLSIVRTSSVSGLMIRYFLKARPQKNAKVAIMGWGPIGRHHYQDGRGFDEGQDRQDRALRCPRHRSGHHHRPGQGQDRGGPVVAGSLCGCGHLHHLHGLEGPVRGPEAQGRLATAELFAARLQDQHPGPYEGDHRGRLGGSLPREDGHRDDALERGLQEKDTKSIVDVVCNDAMASYAKNEPIMFNPMGMAVFDIATGRYYIDKAKAMNIGQELE